MMTIATRYKQHAFWIILGLLTLMGAVLRWHGLLERPLWGDEIYTLAHATGQFATGWLSQANSISSAAMYQEAMQTLADKPTLLEGIQRTVAVLEQNNHPPLFFSMMGFWLQSAGISILTLRFPAYVFGVLSIILVGLVGRALGNTSSSSASPSAPSGWALGLLSATLWALSGYQLFQAQNSRAYTWVICLVLLVALGLLQLSFGRGRYRKLWWPVTILATVAALHSHYFSAPALLALWVLDARYRTARRSWPLWLAIGCVVVGVLPLVPLLFKQWAYLSSETHFTAGLWNSFQLPELVFRMANDHIVPKSDVTKWLLLGVFVAVLLDWLRRQRHHLWISLRQLPPAVVWPLVWFFAVFGAQILLDIVTQSDTLSVRRYTFLASPAFAFLIVQAIQYLLVRLGTFQPQKIGVVKALVWTTLFLLAGQNAWQVAQQHTFANPDVRLAARAVGPSAVGPSAKAPPILVWPGDIRLLSLVWYLPPEAQVAAYSPAILNDETLRQQGGGWIVWIKPTGSRLNRAQKALVQHGWQLVPEPPPAAEPARHRQDIMLWRFTSVANTLPIAKQ